MWCYRLRQQHHQWGEGTGVVPRRRGVHGGRVLEAHREVVAKSLHNTLCHARAQL